MISPAPRHFLSVQYLRAAAAIMVVVYHVTVILPDTFPAFSAGQRGVDLFFVISGFVMWVSARNSAALNFARRRIIRIVPLYWSVTLVAAFVSLDNGYVFGLQESASDLFRSLFFVGYENPGGSPAVSPIVTPGWTLNLEMMFYAIFALGLAIMPRRLPEFMAVALLGLASLWFVLPETAAVPRFYVDSIILEFLAGMGLGMLVTRGIAPSFRGAAAIFAIGLLLIWLPDSLNTGFRLVDWGISAWMIVAGSLWLEQKLARMPLRWLEFLGDASYSVYLTHTMSIAAFALIPVTGGFARTLAATAFAILIGIIVHWFLERPITQAARVVWRKRA